MAQILWPHEIKKEPISDFPDTEDSRKSESLDSKKTLNKGDVTFNPSLSNSKPDYTFFNTSNEKLQMPSTTCDNNRMQQHPREASRQLAPPQAMNINEQALKRENDLGMTFPPLLSSSQSTISFDNNVQISSATGNEDNVQTHQDPWEARSHDNNINGQTVKPSFATAYKDKIGTQQHPQEATSIQPVPLHNNNINGQTVKSEVEFGMMLPVVLSLVDVNEEQNAEIKSETLQENKPVSSSNSEQSTGVAPQDHPIVQNQDLQHHENMSSSYPEIRKCGVVLKREVYDVCRPYLRQIVGFGEVSPDSNEIKSSSSTFSDNEEHSNNIQENNADTSTPSQAGGIKRKRSPKKQNDIQYYFRRQGYLGRKRRKTPQEAICTKLLKDVDFHGRSKVQTPKAKSIKQQKVKPRKTPALQSYVCKKSVKNSAASYMMSLYSKIKKMGDHVLLEDYRNDLRKGRTKRNFKLVMNLLNKVPKGTDFLPVDEVDANLKVDFFPDSESPELDSNKEGNKEKQVTDAADRSQECNERSSEESTLFPEMDAEPLNEMNSDHSDDGVDDPSPSFDVSDPKSGTRVTLLGEIVKPCEMSEQWNSSKAPRPYKKQTVAKSSMILRERRLVNPDVAKTNCLVNPEVAKTNRSGSGKPKGAARKRRKCDEWSSDESTWLSETDAESLNETSSDHSDDDMDDLPVSFDTSDKKQIITDAPDKIRKCNKGNSDESTQFSETDAESLNETSLDHGDDDMDDLPISFYSSNKKQITDKSQECNKRGSEESALCPEMDAKSLNQMNSDNSDDDMDDLPVSFDFSNSETSTCQTVEDEIAKSSEVSEQRNSAKSRRPSEKLTAPKFAMRLEEKKFLNPYVVNRLRLKLKLMLIGQRMQQSKVKNVRKKAQGSQQ